MLCRYLCRHTRPFALSLPLSHISNNLGFPLARTISNTGTVPNSKLKRRAPKTSTKTLIASPELDSRSLLQETKLDEYLQHIASTSHEVTLEDIERYKPIKFPSGSSSVDYEQQYNSLLESLVHSFSFDQLRRFLDLYHLDPPAKRNKWHLAAAIIEHQWKWPSLTKAKKIYKDRTEIVYKCTSSYSVV